MLAAVPISASAAATSAAAGLSIELRVAEDGTQPFDQATDAGPNNQIVRAGDKVKYSARVSPGAGSEAARGASVTFSVTGANGVTPAPLCSAPSGATCTLGDLSAPVDIPVEVLVPQGAQGSLKFTASARASNSITATQSVDVQVKGTRTTPPGPFTGGTGQTEDPGRDFGVTGSASPTPAPSQVQATASPTVTITTTVTITPTHTVTAKPPPAKPRQTKPASTKPATTKPAAPPVPKPGKSTTPSQPASQPGTGTGGDGSWGGTNPSVNTPGGNNGVTNPDPAPSGGDVTAPGADDDIRLPEGQDPNVAGPGQQQQQQPQQNTASSKELVVRDQADSRRQSEITLSRQASVTGLAVILFVIFGILLMEGKLRKVAHAAAVRAAGPRPPARHRRRKAAPEDPQPPAPPVYTVPVYQNPSYPPAPYPGPVYQPPLYQGPIPPGVQIWYPPQQPPPPHDR
ncbi:hypothetical protein D5H75_11380 [Bailinhaonella thermotolerans]|uniref:Uncharacterized protein n=1 Tax=Bailinhaonella thermotolerans TaxID=1070861 RepID=A0A3A4AUW4_9ACTN|nr:hypothetical protein D5H75_11380 [Bailinhaonella thermotolerans]